MSLTARTMTNRKYILAILWNWNHKFFGMKLKGVYFAVRILFLAYLARGRPSSSFASSGKGMLKNILRLDSSESPFSVEVSVSSCMPSKCELSTDSLFFSLDPAFL